MEEKKSLKFNGEQLFLNIGCYSNGRIAITCDTSEEPFSDITINLPNKYLNGINQCYIDELSKAIGLEELLIKENIIERVNYIQSYNMGNYDCVDLNLKKLKEYDPVGFSNFLKEINYEEKIINLSSI